MVHVENICSCSHHLEDWMARLRREKGKLFMNFRSGTPASRQVRLTSLLGMHHSGCPSLLLFAFTSRNLGLHGMVGGELARLHK